MNKTFWMGGAVMSAAALAVCGGATSVSAQKSHKKAAAKVDPVLEHIRDMGSFQDSGGPSGCYDPKQVTGYNRQVMARMGGKPCAPTEPSAPAASSNRRTFPGGETVSLSFEEQGTGGTGTITHRAPGQARKTVTIGYMRGFTGILAANRVRYSVAGTTNRGEETWACEVTIDWRTAKVIAVRDLTRGDHPSCKNSL